MSPKFLHAFQLGPMTVQPLSGTVMGPDGETQHLEPKVMDVLECLAEHGKEIVTRQHLLDTVWSGSTGSDEQLTRAIGEIRRVLNDSPGHPKYIETIPKRGYRLIREVRFAERDTTDSSAIDSKSVNRFAGKKLNLIAFMLLALVFVYAVFKQIPVVPTPVSMPTDDKSIAVLALVNLSDDPDTEYFSDGLSDDILNLLAKVPDLKVVGRTSSFSFKGKNEDIREIGRKLSVKTILEGSVFMSGDQVRITVQLVDVLDGTAIWSDSYQRTMTDIFEVQDEIAGAILTGLNIHVSTNPTRHRPTDVVEAYALFLKARAKLDNPDTGADAALSDLLRATQLDENFAEAYELLAHLYWTQDMPGIPIAEAKELILKSAARALAIDPDLVLSRALYLMANSKKYTSPEIIEAISKAARERPNDPAILRTLTWELLIAGYLDEALRMAERYVDIDPLSPISHIRYAAALHAAGRSDEAVAEMKVAAAITPDTLDWYFGEMFLADNHDQMAIEFMEAYLRQNGYATPTWVEDLVTRGRDPVFGSEYIDKRIPVIVQSFPLLDRDSLNKFYLLLGYLDRYFESILNRISGDSSRTGASMYLMYGMVYRDMGFTAHPDFLKVAILMGLTDVWEQRGPPDFCSKVDGHWFCD